MKYKLSEIALFNPTETLKKGTLAKKVGMDKLQPFCRDIPDYEIAEFSGGMKFRNGDTIMARITPCLENGKTAKVNILDTEEVGFGSTEYIVFRAIDGVTDEDYLYYLVCSPIVRDIAIKSMVGSSGRQRVQTDVVKGIEVELPTLDEQRKIGSLLKILDDKIAVNNEINENLEQQIRSLFRLQFTDNPALEKMKQVPLSDLCQIVTKGTTPTTLGKPFVKSGINFIKAESILDSHAIDKNKFSFIDNETNALLKRSVIKAGDIVFTIAGTLGRFALIDKNVLPANTNQAVAIIRVDAEKVLPEYIYACFIGGWHNHYYKKLVQQAVQANLSLTTIKSLPIPLLDESEMVNFTKLIIPLIKIIKQHEVQNEILTSMRDTLLSKLMSGEIDVSKLDI